MGCELGSVERLRVPAAYIGQAAAFDVGKP